MRKCNKLTPVISKNGVSIVFARNSPAKYFQLLKTLDLVEVDLSDANEQYANRIYQCHPVKLASVKTFEGETEKWKHNFVSKSSYFSPIFLSKTVQNQVLDKKIQLNTQWKDIPSISENKLAFSLTHSEAELESNASAV